MPSSPPPSSPSPLTDRVVQVFAADGPLARAWGQAPAAFRPRAGQQAMAAAVAQAITCHERLVVEAGTGVGKTFAYLVPALLSGERVLVSTATKALQDQLHARDLPALAQALALPLRTALLKGRANYLCRHRLEQARHGETAAQPALAQELARIEQWAQATRTGDLAQLPGLDERSPVIPLVTSTQDNCLGPDCPQFRACHVYQARREALQADVVVINHHLFFADLAVRESGVAQLLPGARVVVFDEAHQLMETATQFYGAQFGTSQLLALARDLLAVGQQHARGFADWPALHERLGRAARQLRSAAVAPGNTDITHGRLRWVGAAPDGVPAQAWQQALAGVVEALRAVLAGLDPVTAAAPGLAHLHARTVELLQRVLPFFAPVQAPAVRWLDVAGSVRMVEVPLDMAPTLQALWQGAPAEPSAWDEDGGPQPAQPAQAADSPGARTWVFTSATLGDDDGLRWFTEACGLRDARVLRVGSPFDYERQAALYVPAQLPPPTDPAHSALLAHWVGDAVARLGGRTLVLTTSVQALEVIAAALQQRFVPGGGIEVLVQGQAPKRQLMERFRAAAGAVGMGDSGERTGCTGYVLVGSASFWEGFDVPGQALQLVVIDKLPFPPPGDPLVQARGQRMAQQGRSAFWSDAVPAAAVALKQGAGRLIRTESDAGVLVVADTRLVGKGYGKRLLRALPPLQRLETQEAFDARLDALTTASTTGRSWP